MHVDPDELMAYFDGELSPARAARVQQALDRDPELRATLLEWEWIGNAVRDWSRSVSASHRVGTNGIMRRLEPRSSGAVVPFPGAWGRPAPGGHEDTAGAHPSAPVAGSPNPPQLRAHVTWRHAAGAALAVAAAALVLAKTAGHESHLRATAAAPVVVQASGLSGRDVQADADERPGAEIEALDLGERQGTVFLVSAGSGVTPVVWLQDDLPSGDGPNDLPSEEHDRAKTL
jgi:anti-sigma factor RsiW